MGKIRPIMVKGHERPLTMVKYNREGDLLFTCAKDHTPCVFYSDNGERIGTYKGHCGTVWCIDINFSCDKLLTGSADNSVKLWEVQTGECLHTWKHTGSVRDVGFAMGDKEFLSVLDNIMGNVPTIFVWDLELHNLANHPDCPKTTILGHKSKIIRALWGPLNKHIYAAGDDAVIRLWDPKTEKLHLSSELVHGKRITDMQFSEDKCLLVTSCADHWVRLFDARTLQLLKAFNTERNINSAAISPRSDCPYVIAGGGQDAMAVTTTSSKQGKFEISFYDHCFGDELGSIGGHFGPVNTISFSPDGRSFASGGEDGYVRINHLDQAYFEAHKLKVEEAKA